MFIPENLDRWTANGPTSFDSVGNYAGDDMGDFYVAPVAINRDTADSLTLSNWRFITAELERLARHDDTGVCRFGHWACGWYEMFLIHQTDTAALEAADRWAVALADYPVASEDDMSELEVELEGEHWESWGLEEWRRVVIDSLQEYAPESADQWWAEEIIDTLGDDKLTTLWHDIAQHLSWDVEHRDDGPSFNFRDGKAALTCAVLADLTGLALLSPEQEWRREPYPWPGAEPAPLVGGLG